VRLFTDADMVEVMGGHYPPADAKQAAAYFEIAWARMAEAFGREFEVASLLAGGIPDGLFDWVRDRGRSKSNGAAS